MRVVASQCEQSPGGELEKEKDVKALVMLLSFGSCIFHQK